MDERLGAVAPRIETARPAPIRDAATLVVIDGAGAGARILVGRRSAGHVFMPGKIVFPGGRIDPSDLRVAKGFELEPHAIARMTGATRARFDDRRATALALAAIRETFEETGVMIGTTGSPFASAAPFWRDFAARGLRPSPATLRPFARAITPPGRIRRYDTRFLAVSASAIGHRTAFDDLPTDELEGVAWMTMAELESEDLAAITRMALSDLAERLAAGNIDDVSIAMPFYRFRNGRQVRSVI